MADIHTNNGVTLTDFLDDGGVQALCFETQDGKRTIGVVAPGVHDFGIVNVKPETIVVTSGTLTISGILLKTGGRYLIQTGDHIVFETEDFASYLCIKG